MCDVPRVASPPITPPVFPTRTLDLQVEKAQQDKQSAIIRAEGEAQSATLIGQAIKDNPAFLTLRCVGRDRGLRGGGAARQAAPRGSLRGSSQPTRSHPFLLLNPPSRRIEAAREIAQTVATSGNRMMLPADSLLLNMSGLDTSVKRK